MLESEWGKQNGIQNNCPPQPFSQAPASSVTPASVLSGHCAGLQGLFQLCPPPPISHYKIEGSCMILAEQELLPSYFNYESDEEWWDSRMGLYFISVNNLKCTHLAFWESQIRWK